MNNLKKLVAIELYKLRKGRSKYILFISFLFMLVAPILILQYSNDLSRTNDFYYCLQNFYDVNYDLLLPICIGIFTLSFICNEYKNKPIKNLIMSRYSKSYILLSKYIALVIYTITTYIVIISLYTFISYRFSNKSPIYFNYKVASLGEVIINLLQYNFMIILYLCAVIAFSLMLGLIFKKQGLSIIIYLITITTISVVFMLLESRLVLFRQYTFMALSSIDFLGVPGYNYMKLKSIIPGFSNIFLFLGIGNIGFDNYQY